MARPFGLPYLEGLIMINDISGVIRLADMVISFSCNSGENKASYYIEREGIGVTKHCDSDKLLKALAIMIHNDGTPDYKVDYDDAESTQPSDPEMRFIP